ncbi:dihydroxyacetone kinase subunit DhaK [Saliterribacillus persicus]|uniref:dihydroxyacetone kinase subunit DhaK n=1 Tax=Saliterribacillus persicus TaxID=930114 RepID=UPI000DF3C7C5|nr:dihydroxyacetone kinase subunit DhaK [Saliterribacillus persicus]
MKKLINHPEQVVEEMIEGILLAHPGRFERIEKTTVLTRKSTVQLNKVGLVSGGGSGHEPAHVGYVGEGMLDAAVFGEVFTSPTPDQILEAIKAVDYGKGVLLIIKNYTGDVMNFEMAQELAEAEGIQVEKVIVADDVAVEDSTFTIGRRGIAGTVLVHRIAGAMAETGATLQEVKEAAEKVINNVRSMGMAISACTVPAAGKPSFQLADDEMEIGIGIHGEPGINRTKIQSSKEVASILVNKILADFNYENSEVAVLINGLGATPEMELYILNKEVQRILTEKNVAIYKTWVGEYMTSLEMSGVSVTLLKLDNQMKELFAQKVNTLTFQE